MTFDRVAVVQALADHGTITGAARELGVDRRRLSEYVNAEGLKPDAITGSNAKTEVRVDGDSATITTPADLGDIETLIRERGLDPADWVVVSTTLNEWDGQTADGIQRLRQWKVTLRRAPHLVFLAPVVHVPELSKAKAKVRVSVHEPDVIVIEGDHQAPYFDPRLDACVTSMVAELQPTEHVFLGDTGDYPTISRHADHPAAMATVGEVNAAVYGILRRRAEAAPNARRRKLKGNHDWRLEGELLARCERLYDLTPVGEDEPVWSLRRILHLDRLGIELVTDPRGWQHGEVELVGGMHGLVVRHGWLTGTNTAEKSLDKRGRSILFGHIHTRDHVFKWDPSAGVERQAAAIGAMCLVRDERFPHFAVCDNWLQGPATVMRWPDGRWKIEHAEYSDGALTWRDKRWEAA